MRKYKIFVSGIQKELRAERYAVKQAVVENPLFRDYFSTFLFEESPAKGKPAKKSYIDEVRKSDIYVGVLGNEYGKVSGKKLSPTEQEFREAQKQGKEILIHIKGKDNEKRDKRIKKLITEIRDPETGYSYRRFNSLLGQRIIFTKA